MKRERVGDGLDLDEPGLVLWSTKDIAEAWSLNRQYVTDVLTKRHDFPRPVLALSQKMKRWDRDACEAFRKRTVK